MCEECVEQGIEHASLGGSRVDEQGGSSVPASSST